MSIDLIAKKCIDNIFKNLFRAKYDEVTIKEIFAILNIKINKKSDLYSIMLSHHDLRNADLIAYFYSLIPTLKDKKYYSHKLTCLHKNSIEKQKFPAINLLRQILKCNSLKLKPKVVCKGYSKVTGKKITERFFVIEDL